MNGDNKARGNMKTSGEKNYLPLLVDKVQALPYHRFIGLMITGYGDGYCRISVPVSENVLNPCGAVHGGIIYSLCDVAAYIAVSTTLADDQLAVTSDINASLLSAVMQGTLLVEAKIIKAGKRICYLEARVTDAEGNLIAVSRVTKSVIAYPQMKDLLKKDRPGDVPI
jgi:uncharacterized protein (TIGR00369 family)